MAGQRGGQHARAAADVEHFPFGMRLEGGEQQLAADVQTVAAEDARQGFNRQIIQCVFAPECVGVEGRLLFQTTMIEATAARAIHFV